MTTFRARMWDRLTRNIREPDNEQSCWVWGRRIGRGGYGQIDVHTPGMGRNATYRTHIVLWVLMHGGEWIDDADDLYWAYKSLTLFSGLELDHLCVCSSCVNVDHLEPVSPIENIWRRDARRVWDYETTEMFDRQPEMAETVE